MTLRIGPRPWVRQLRRALAAVALLVVTVPALLLSVVTSDGFADRVRRQGLAFASVRLGLDIAAEQLQIRRLWPLEVGLVGVTVHAAEGARAGLPLLTLDEARVALGTDLSGDLIPIEAVRLYGPSARVALENGRLRDFAPLLERLQAKGPEQPNEPVRKPPRIELRELWVAGAATRLSAEPLGLAVAVAGAELGYQQDGAGDGAGTVAVASVGISIGPLREQISLEPAGFRVQAGLVNIDPTRVALRTADVDIEGTVHLPGPASVLGYSITGRADVHVERLAEVVPGAPSVFGELRVSATARSDGGPPDVAFEVEGEGLAVHAWNKRQQRTQIFLAGSPTLVGRFAENRLIVLPTSAVAWGGGLIRPEGWLELGGDMPWELRADVQGLGLERVLESVTVPGSWVQMQMDGRIRMDGKLKNGLLGRGEGHIAVSDLVVRTDAWDAPVPGQEVLRVPHVLIDTGLLLEADHVFIAPATLTGPRSDLSVSADLIFTKPLTLDIDVRSDRLAFEDLQESIAGLPIAGLAAIGGTVRGKTREVQVAAELDVQSLRLLDKWEFGRVAGAVGWTVGGDLEFTGLRAHRGSTDYEAEVRLQLPDVRRGGTRERVELAVDARVPKDAARVEDLLPIFFGNDLGASGSVWGEATLRGPPQALRGSATVQGERVAFRWEEFASLDLRAEVRDGVWTLPEAWARKEDGSALFARGSFHPGGALDFEFRIPDMPLGLISPVARALGERSDRPLEGRVRGGAVLGGTLRSVTVDADLELLDLSYRGESLGDSHVRAVLRDHVLQLDGDALGRRVRIESASLGTRHMWPYELDLVAAGLPLTPFLPRREGGREPATAGAGGRLTGSGTLKDSWHELRLQLSELWLQREDRRIEVPPSGATVAWSRGALRLEDVTLASPDGETALAASGWLRPDGPLDVQVEGRIDLAFLDLVSGVFDRNEARRTRVKLAARGLSMAALELEAEVELQEALLRTVFFPHAVEIDDALLTLRGRRVEVERFAGRLGGGDLSRLDASYLLLDRSFRPRVYDLRARCTGCTLRYPSFLPATTGDLDLSFAGEAPDRLLLSGKVHVQDMVLRDPLNWQRSALTVGARATENLAREPGQGLFSLDLRFTSEPEAIRMVNNVGRIRATAREFGVVGDTRRIELVGGLQIDGGQLPYNGQEFTLDPGTATFSPGAGWFPVLDLRMWTDVLNRDRNYRISYTITGPLNRPTLVPFSEPALAENDINSLLLLGLTGQQIEEANLTQLAAAASATAVGTLLENTATAVGQNVQTEALRPDRVEIVPVYTDTTGSTTIWAVFTKEAVPGRLTLESGVGFGGARASLFSSAFRAKLRFSRNLYLEGSWIRDDNASSDLGNFGLDLKLELDVDP